MRTPRELVLHVLERRLHPLVDFGEQPFQIVDIHRRLSLRIVYAVTSDPIGSPMIARLMLPGVRRLKTTIGSRLSMHSEIAVASITFRPCSSTCRYEMRSKRVRVGLDHRVGVVDAVDLGGLQDDVGLDFHRAQRRGGVGAEVRIAGAGAEDDDAALFRGGGWRGGG